MTTENKKNIAIEMINEKIDQLIDSVRTRDQNEGRHHATAAGAYLGMAYVAELINQDHFDIKSQEIADLIDLL